MRDAAVSRDEHRGPLRSDQPAKSCFAPCSMRLAKDIVLLAARIDAHNVASGVGRRPSVHSERVGPAYASVPR